MHTKYQPAWNFTAFFTLLASGSHWPMLFLRLLVPSTMGTTPVDRRPQQYILCFTIKFLSLLNTNCFINTFFLNVVDLSQLWSFAKNTNFNAKLHNPTSLWQNPFYILLLTRTVKRCHCSYVSSPCCNRKSNLGQKKTYHKPILVHCQSLNTLPRRESPLHQSHWSRKWISLPI